MGRDDDGECRAFEDGTIDASTDDLDGGDFDDDGGGDGSDDDTATGVGDGGTGAGSDGSTPPDDATADGTTTIKGSIATTNGTGFVVGDKVLLQAWKEESIDPATGWPADGDPMPIATQVSGAALTTMTIHYSFVVGPISSSPSGVNVRLTAHFADDPTEWVDAPRGMYPTAIDEWLTVVDGVTTEGIIITVDNGEPEPDVGPPAAPDEGTPADTPAEPDEGPPVEPDEGPPVEPDEGPPVEPDEGPPADDEGAPGDTDGM